MTAQFDRDIAVAEALVAALRGQALNSICTVFVEMYTRHKRGEESINVRGAFMLGNFTHGRIANKAIDGALKAGYITGDKPNGVKYSLLSPTQKLLDLVQSVIDVEALPWEVSEQHRKHGELIALGMKHFDSVRAELERDHLGKRVWISCKTGRYIVESEDNEKMREFTSSLEPDDLFFSRTISVEQIA